MPEKVKIKFRQGLETNRTAVTPEHGVPLWDTDTKKMYVGDGSTAGGNLIGPYPFASDAHIVYVDSSDASGVNGGLSSIPGGRAAYEYAIVQLGPGTYDASNFKFDGYTDVIVRGVGDATVIECEASAQGTLGDYWPDTLNFSNNNRCGLENMQVRWSDNASYTAVEQGAIMRASNSATTDCWFRDLTIVVQEMNSGRTGNSVMVFGVGYIPGSTPDAFVLKYENIRIISSCSGVRNSDGQVFFNDCDIWFGNTANTNTPNLIGFDYNRGGRWYWRSGRISTGYSTTNPSTDAAVIGIRGNQASTGGRGFVWDALIFARNEAATVSTIKSVFLDDASGGNGWLRMWNCYLQAERDTPTYDDVEAVETDWSPSNNVDRIELYECHTSGIKGNVLGTSGQVTVSAAATVTSNGGGKWFADTTSAGFTLTMHGNQPDNNDEVFFKNIGSGGQDLTIAVATGDYLNGTINGTYLVHDGQSVRIRGRTLSGTVIYWETLDAGGDVYATGTTPTSGDVAIWNGDKFIKGDANVNWNSALGNFIIKEAKDDNVVGPELYLIRDSASPAQDDELGAITFYGEDSSSNQTQYGRIVAGIQDPTTTTEKGKLSTYLVKNGGLVKYLTLHNNDHGLLRLGDDVADTSEGPTLEIHRDNSSPAANDLIGSIHFRGMDSGAGEKTYAKFVGEIVSPTDTTESGALRVYTTNSGTQTHHFTFESDGSLHSELTNYETLVTDDDDIPNKKYVDDGDKDTEPHTWAIAGEIKVPSGATDFILPFYVFKSASETVTLTRARHSIYSGTSATVKLQKNGADITGWTGISVTTTHTTTDGTDTTFADTDRLALVVTGVSGTPTHMSFTVEFTREK